jgi:hypothetical protein
LKRFSATSRETLLFSVGGKLGQILTAKSVDFVLPSH